MKRLALVSILVLLALAPLAGARIPGSPIVAGPGAWLTTYATQVAETQVSASLAFLNEDLMRHDVVAFRAYGADDRSWCSRFPQGRCPAFWSPLASLGEMVTVQGTDQLQPATTYTFYCTLHPKMTGTLVTLPDSPLT